MQKRDRMTIWGGGLILAALCLAPVSTADACSVCLCGDDFFFYLGEPVLANNRLEFTFQEQYMSKTSGPLEQDHHGMQASIRRAGIAHDEADLVKLREHRLSLRASYRLNRAVSLFVKTPLVIRNFTSVSDGVQTRESATGLGDIEISSMVSGEFIERPTASYTATFIASVKTPSGENDKLLEDGHRLDEHLQAGTGSWGGQIGAVLARTSMMHSEYSSAYIRTTGENDFGYKYGTSYLYNFGFMYRAKSALALTTEINGRYAARDELDGVDLHNSGGSVIYLTPGLRWLLGPTVSLTANLRVPVIEDLNEDQNEGLVLVGEIGLRR